MTGNLMPGLSAYSTADWIDRSKTVNAGLTAFATIA
jgi:hypothetical protein